MFFFCKRNFNFLKKLKQRINEEIKREFSTGAFIKLNTRR